MCFLFSFIYNFLIYVIAIDLFIRKLKNWYFISPLTSFLHIFRYIRAPVVILPFGTGSFFPGLVEIWLLLSYTSLYEISYFCENNVLFFYIIFAWSLFLVLVTFCFSSTPFLIYAWFCGSSYCFLSTFNKIIYINCNLKQQCALSSWCSVNYCINWKSSGK